MNEEELSNWLDTEWEEVLADYESEPDEEIDRFIDSSVVIPISDNETRKRLAVVECSAYARTNSRSWRIADDRPTVSR